ncbi:MAG: hypothetical protein KBG15_04685 [Kofleriaceae bacterium]|nr:hypothetical protein [Kofleriaceae bacterium]
MKLAVVCSIVATLVTIARVEAEACSCAMADALGFVAASGELPANAKGVVWIGRSKPSAKAIKVFRLVANGKVSVPFKIDALGLWDKTDPEFSLFLIRPTRAMKPGQHYRFVSKEHSGSRDAPQTLEYAVSDQPLTEAMDTVELSATPVQAGTERVSDISGRCSNSVAAVASNISVVLPKAWAPFSEQLLYRTIVNDKPWHPKSSLCRTVMPGRSQQRTATDRIFRRCSAEAEADAGVAITDARVVIEITAPTVDAKLLIRTQPLTIALNCP